MALKYNPKMIQNINPIDYSQTLSSVATQLDDDLYDIKETAQKLINSITDIAIPNVIKQPIYSTPTLKRPKQYNLPVVTKNSVATPSVATPSIKYNQDSKQKALKTVSNKYLGKPYIWGAKVGDERGADCSSLTSCYAKNVGEKIPRTAYSQFKYFKSKGRVTTDLSQANTGDLVYFDFRNRNKNPIGHTAIIKEVTPKGIKIIEASGGHKKVIERYLPKSYYKHIAGIAKL